MELGVSRVAGEEDILCGISKGPQLHIDTKYLTHRLKGVYVSYEFKSFWVKELNIFLTFWLTPLWQVYG